MPILRAVAGGAFLLAATAAAAQTADDALSLDTITVEGTAATGTSAIVGVVPDVTATATKTDTAILETPQSVSVVGTTQIEQTGAQTLAQSLNYVPGVQSFGARDGTGDSLITRGFRLDPYTGNIFRDGMRLQVNLYDGAQELYGLERVELLRGPSSILYGQSGPAGVLNTVSKRPTDYPLRSVEVQAGTFDWMQLAGDVGGPIGDGPLSWRLTGLVRDADTFIDDIPDDRRFLQGGLTWSPDDRTSLTLLGLYQHDRTAYVYGLPGEGTILPNPNGRIPRDRFVGEPGYDKYDGTQYALTYLLDHQITADLAFRSSARWYTSDIDMPSINAGGVLEDMRTSAYRGAQDRTDTSEGGTADNNLTFDWAAGGIRHTSLAGFDFSWGEHTTDRANRDAAPIDWFDPVYGLGIDETVDSAYAYRDQTNRYGLYLQDQMWIGERWVATVGVRQDWVDYSEWETLTGEKTADGEKSDALTGRAGVVWLGPNGIAPYASWSTSFEPVAGSDRTGSRFKPTTGEQYEAGVRWQPPGRDLQLSAAVYQITQKNVTVTDPADTDFSMQQGEVRSRGVELEARGNVTDTLELIAAYAYTDARTTEAGPLSPGSRGQRTTGVPYNQASLWADYDFVRVLPGLSAGAGVRYIGETNAEWMGNLTVPAYTLIDANLQYQRDDWTVRLNATNLTDKTYVAGCTYACFWGSPRTVILTAAYTW